MTFADILLTLLRGAGYTLLITFACAATALVVGLGIAVARELGGAWVSAVLSAWVYVFRGIPMLVLLFVVFFGLPGIGIDVPPLLAMMLSLGLISGAYLSEVFRGALAANPRRALRHNPPLLHGHGHHAGHLPICANRLQVRANVDLRKEARRQTTHPQGNGQRA